jgi:hypothetical protein
VAASQGSSDDSFGLCSRSSRCLIHESVFRIPARCLGGFRVSSSARTQSR